MRQRSFTGLIVLFFFCISMNQVFARNMEILIANMISIYSASSKGIQDTRFRKKVAEIDEYMRKQLERDQNISSMKELIKTAQKFNDRKSARKMFEIVLEKAYKRLQFTKIQQDFPVSEVMHQDINTLISTIEKYLDPNMPDLDAVDRNSLEAKRKRLKSKVRKAYKNKIDANDDSSKRITVEVTGEDGSEAKLAPSREANLLAKLATVVPEPGKMAIKIKLTRDETFKLDVDVNNFIAPNGYSVIKGELGFADISLKSLDNSNATEVDDVLGNAYFNRYMIVQDEEQLNVMPKVGESSYEMGSLAPGQIWKMPLKKISDVSDIVAELEGHTEIAVINGRTAKADRAIKFQNNGTRNMIFLQGTDMTGLVSVKAIGFLVPKKGQVTFREVLIIVDDELSSNITRYIGGQGINWFLKKASNNLRKGLPFTPILENINMNRGDDGKMVYIFSGRGIVAR